MPNSPERSQERAGLQDAQINRALGLFLLFFACVVLVSVFFTPTLVGKLTNLAAGAIIGLIAAVMICRSRKRVL